MISVHETEKLTLEQIEKFLLATEEVRFEASKRAEVYSWVEQLLCQQDYSGLGRAARGLLRRYIGKMTGLSRAQTTRLVGRYVATGRVRVETSRRHRFPTRYIRADIELLAQVDEAHEPSVAPPLGAFSSASFASTASQSFSGWHRFPTDTCTTCAVTRAIASGSTTTKRRGPPRWRLASAGSLIPWDGPAICGSIPCSRARPQTLRCWSVSLAPANSA